MATPSKWSAVPVLTALNRRRTVSLSGAQLQAGQVDDRVQCADRGIGGQWGCVQVGGRVLAAHLGGEVAVADVGGE
ncbi:hypothetical protein [Streptomyces sp. IGB124]|uniref:hypothetical protein n=1 Tax=Streptomyces sp. IGB124 TaxID=1519485 RepID=UPI002D218B1D|nr:hypothetical protein [Streptomyces sp. IGB124]